MRIILLNNFLITFLLEIILFHEALMITFTVDNKKIGKILK
jgi:hypothetical protein